MRMSTNIGLFTAEKICWTGNISGTWIWMAFIRSETIFTVNHTIANVTHWNASEIIRLNKLLFYHRKKWRPCIHAVNKVFHVYMVKS